MRRAAVGQASIGRSGRWLAFAFAAYVLAFLLLVLFQPFSRSVYLGLEDAASGVPPLAAGLFSFRTALRARGQTRRAWLLFGAGCISFGLGDVIWTFYDAVLGIETPFPSAADAAYLASYPLFFAGLFILTTPPKPAARVRIGLDALAVSAAVGAVVWHFVLRQIYFESDATFLQKVLSGAYPLADLGLLFALVMAVPAQRRRQTDALLALIGAGICWILVTDLLFAYLSLDDSYAGSSLIDIGWVIGFCFLGFAASLQDASRGNAVRFAMGQETTSWRDLLPLAVLPLVVGWGSYTNLADSADIPTGLFTLVFACCVVARQTVAFIDSLVLNRRLKEANDRLAGLNEALQDRAQGLAQNLSEALGRANLDPLTNLLNRRVFIEQLLVLLSRPQPATGALGFADVDGMKLLNDRFGHGFGDQALQRVALALGPSYELLCARYGGDEFVVFLPGAGPQEAEAYARDVERRLRESCPDEEEEELVGVSFGFAYWPREAASVNELLRLADARMYIAKREKPHSRDFTSAA